MDGETTECTQYPPSEEEEKSCAKNEVPFCSVGQLLRNGLNLDSLENPTDLCQRFGDGASLGSSVETNIRIRMKS